MANETRSDLLRVRVKPAEKELLEHAAEQEGLDVSAFIRHSAVVAARVSTTHTRTSAPVIVPAKSGETKRK